MPRRDSYLTDDDDDTPRRAAASGGGGVPRWVWLLGGGGALAALMVLAFGFFAFSRREAMHRHEVARADSMRLEMQARQAQIEGANAEPGDMAIHPGQLPILSLTRITNLYKNNRADAEVRYTNQRVRVWVEVKAAGVGADGDAWVGAPADLGAGVPRGGESNVVFRMVGEPVAVGTTIELEGRCDGLLPHPRWGEVLTFTDCRVARE